MGKRKDKGKNKGKGRLPPEKKDMNTTKLQRTMDEVRKLHDEDPGKALDAINNSGIDLKTVPELWEMHILLLDKLNKSNDSFLSASKYAKVYNVEGTINPELVKILGHGEMMAGNYSRAYSWYKVGSVIENASLLAHCKARKLTAFELCQKKGSIDEILNMINELCSHNQREEVMELIDKATVLQGETSLSNNLKVHCLVNLGCKDDAFNFASDYIGDRTPEQVVADPAFFANTVCALATSFANTGNYKAAVDWYKVARMKAQETKDDDEEK